MSQREIKACYGFALYVSEAGYLVIQQDNCTGESQTQRILVHKKEIEELIAVILDMKGELDG